MKFRPTLLAPVLLLIINACGGGGGESTTPALPALNPPSAVTATPAPGMTNGLFIVSWTEPSAAVERYELEGRIGSGPFAIVGSGNIPTGVKSIMVDATGLAELTPLTFRLRSVRGTAFSDYSNEATTKVPINPPAFPHAYFDSSRCSMHVSWGNSSLLATRVKVEKAILTFSQPGPFTTLIEGPITILETYDTDLKEDTSYRYRITLSDPGENSSAIHVDSNPLSLLAPRITSTESTASVVTVHWQGTSSNATEMQVQRGDGFYSSSFTTIASVPLNSTQYVDADIAAGFYSYRILVRTPTDTAYSVSANVVTSPTGSGLTLTTTLISLPTELKALDAWSGAPALLASGTEYGSYVITPPAGASWPSRTVYNVAVIHESGFTVDGQGRPHFLYRRNLGVSSSQQSVVHEWFNGTAWSSEELFRSGFSGLSASEEIRYAVSSEGIVHAIWQASSYPTTLWYGTNRSGSWESISLEPAGGPSSLVIFRLAVGLDGTAFVALGLGNKVVLFSRPTGIQSFSQEEVPTGTIQASWYDPLEIQPFGAQLSLFFERYESSSGETQYLQMGLIKSQGSWGQTFLLASRPHAGALTVTKAAASADGRLVYAVKMPEGLTVFSLASNQTWSSVLLAPAGATSPIHLGFNSQNKFWCAIDGGWGPVSGMDIYAWYAE